MAGDYELVMKELTKVNSIITSDIKGALKIMEDLIADGNDQPCLHLALGDVYRIQGSSQEAIKYYLLAINQEYEYKDYQVKLAAKAGLAHLYIKEAWDEFDALPREEQTENLHNLIPNCIRNKPFQYLTFLGPCGNACVPFVGGQGRKSGFPSPNDCQPCKT